MAREVASFGRILNIELTRTEFEAGATIIMAHRAEAENVMQLLKRKFTLAHVQLTQLASQGLQMRELWVGNLAQTVTQEKLYNRFFIYGEIEVIYMFMSKNFAFIRFKEMVAAAQALDLARGIKIDGRQIKISFADPVRRKEALGDMPGYHFDIRNTKGLVMKYTGTSMAPQEDFAKGVLGRYGTVKAILIAEVGVKPMTRPRVYIEFSTHVNCL